MFLVLLAFGLGALCGAFPVVGIPVTGGVLALGGGALLLIRWIYDTSVRG